MIEFISLIVNNEIPFLRNAIIISLLGSIPLGMLGCLVIIKRMSYIVGALSHSLFFGIGLSLLLGDRITFSPQLGMMIVAVLISLVLAQQKQHSHREDANFSLLWSLGMGLGILFIYIVPGYVNVSSYLFGSILMVDSNDLYMIAGLVVLVVLIIIFCYRRFLILVFDEEYFYTRSKHVGLYRSIFFLLIGVSIAALASLVGILLLIALLTLPSSACLSVCKNTKRAMIASIPLTMCTLIIGIALSYFLDLPTGASIVIIAAIVYIIAQIFVKLRRLLFR